jgi:hypothetical protein
MIRFIILMTTATLLSAESEAPKLPAELTVERGQARAVAGTDLTITLESVVDLGSRGCLGGPLGCPSRARLRVVQAEKAEQLVVSSGATAQSRRAATAFGYRITLVRAQGDTATLRVEKADIIRAP